jgi:hypothetical protein
VRFFSRLTVQGIAKALLQVWAGLTELSCVDLELEVPQFEEVF